MNKKNCSCLARLVFSLTLLSLPVQATTIRYEATDLADIDAGEDIWRYRYQVSDRSFLTDFGFDIYFEVANGHLFGDLNTPTTSNSGWDIVSIQPDPALPHDGFLDALALADGPSLTDSFFIDFIWRGVGSPASQRFEVFDASLNVIESGRTIPFGQTGVPEPTTAWLALLGLVFVIRFTQYKLDFVFSEYRSVG
jgi:hypothetical protein